MRDDPSVVALVTRAAGSDEGAWHELVDRYAPLVWSICVRYQLSGADIDPAIRERIVELLPEQEIPLITAAKNFKVMPVRQK